MSESGKNLLEGISAPYFEANNDPERVQMLFALHAIACRQIDGHTKRITALEDQLKKLNTQRITEPATYPPDIIPAMRENPAPKHSLIASPIDIFSMFMKDHPFWLLLTIVFSVFAIFIVIGLTYLLAINAFTIGQLCEGIGAILSCFKK